ncbi:conserved hypothetical protein [Burkholderia pseudomallei 406e]|nr:conserved hypothetical protein [Burkholderia pseudomallei 406e]
MSPRRRLARGRVRADDRREIGELQQIRHELAGQERPRRALLVHERAAQIAAADAAVEVLVTERARGALETTDEPAFGRVRRRVGQGHARERIQVRHARALQPQPQVDRGEMDRIGERPDDREARVARLHVGLQREWPRSVPKRQHAAHLARAVDRHALVAALHGQAERVGRAGRPLLGGGGRACAARARNGRARRDGRSGRCGRRGGGSNRPARARCGSLAGSNRRGAPAGGRSGRLRRSARARRGPSRP